MKTSGLFTVHGFKIPCKLNQPFRIIFFGDVHRDAPAHALEKWKEFLAYARGQKDAWFFGMGDYLDSTSTSERECLGNISAKMHETFRDDIVKLQRAKVELLGKELAFMKGRIIGMLNGNHYFEFPEGMNGDQLLCQSLGGAKYLGVCSFVRLTFETHGRRATRDVFAHHGAGAARLVGGSLNRVAQMAEGAEADIFAMGHDHKRGAVPGQPRLFLKTTKAGLDLESREPVILRTGSFLKSFEPNRSNYNVDACRPPSSLGHVELIVTVKRHRTVEEDSLNVEMRTLS